MNTTLAQQLGYGPEERLVLFHADDLGMSHGSNVAFLELAAAGIVQCGSIMLPCPWSAEMLEMCAAQPDLDVGVHLTLTAEWPQYRWAPLVERNVASGLVDAAYNFWPTTAHVRNQLQSEAQLQAVARELRAQIDVARAAGIQITHLDSHMGSCFIPQLVDVYLALGQEYGIPVFAYQSADSYMRQHGISDLAAHRQRLVANLHASGMPVMDYIRISVCYTQMPAPAPSAELYEEILRSLEPGITYFMLHPNAPGDIEMIDPSSAPWRIFEYKYFQSTRLDNFLAQEGIKSVGFRAIYDLLQRKTQP